MADARFGVPVTVLAPDVVPESMSERWTRSWLWTGTNHNDAARPSMKDMTLSGHAAEGMTEDAPRHYRPQPAPAPRPAPAVAKPKPPFRFADLVTPAGHASLAGLGVRAEFMGDHWRLTYEPTGGTTIVSDSRMYAPDNRAFRRFSQMQLKYATMCLLRREGAFSAAA